MSKTTGQRPKRHQYDLPEDPCPHSHQVVHLFYRPPRLRPPVPPRTRSFDSSYRPTTTVARPPRTSSPATYKLLSSPAASQLHPQKPSEPTMPRRCTESP